MAGREWNKFIVVGILGLVVFLSALTGFWEQSELGFYDTWFNLRGPKNPGQDIVIIAMDEKSISQLGPLPWERSIHARLLECLAEARVVGFDILFDGPTTPKEDRALAEAIQAHGRVVLGGLLSFDFDDRGATASFKCGLDFISENAANVGYMNMIADKGDIVRRAAIVDPNFDFPIPSLALAVASVSTGTDLSSLELTPGRLQAGSLSVPVQNANQFLLDFWGPARTFPTCSYIDVVNGVIPAENFRDKTVLICTYTPTERSQKSGDVYNTPFTRSNLVLSGGMPLPGVEIHASALKTILGGHAFRRAPLWVNALFLILLWAAAVFISRSFSPWKALGGIFILLGGVLGLVYLSWLKAHFWINTAAPIALIGFTYVGSTVENIVRTEMERRRTRTMFARYVSPAVVDEIMKNPEAVHLGGEKKVVTVMFADIRGFTAYSENKDPADVIFRLNEYLSAMTDIILAHGGTLDKYLGDGLMAFFGAPLPLEHHVERAVKAAIDIQARVEELNRNWSEQGAVPLKVAVGINTGPAVVGNVGSNERMDYTLIGEDVNLASRVEALSKLFETLIVISERSYNLIRDDKLRERLYYLGSELVKGFTNPINCYSVSGLDLHFEKSTDQGFK